MKFLQLKQIDDVFVDGLLTDENRLLFMSCWAAESRAQELTAKLSLPESEDGFLGGVLTFERPDGTVLPIDLPADAKLDKEQGRMPATALFGDRMAHVMIFDRLVGSVDKVNRKAIAIRRANASVTDLDDRLWRLINDVAAIPLLDDWREPMMAAFREEGWLYPIPGFGVDGVMLNLADAALERWISEQLTSGVLTVPPHGERRAA